jgi:transcriptional regulator with XRE-family HTH domain
MTYLQKLRKNAGLTQAELAAGLGYTSPQFISNIERGLAALPSFKFKKAAKLLGVGVNLLIDQEVKNYRESLIKSYGVI